MDQRQLVNLALGLQSKGHEVSIFVYHPQIDFFERELQSAQLKLSQVRGGFIWEVQYSIRPIPNNSVVRAKSDHFFLDTPNVLVESVGMLQRLLRVKTRPKLIVSERSNKKNETSLIKSLLFRMSHVLADVVVCNSYTHAAYLKKFFWITSKVHVIYNGLLEESFTERLAMNKITIHISWSVVYLRKKMSLMFSEPSQF